MSSPTPNLQLQFKRQRSKTHTITAILVAILALTTAVFYYEYANQVRINSQQSQLQNGVPIGERDACFITNLDEHHPSITDFYSLLPKTLENVTIGAEGLLTSWPIPVNKTDFLLYEVWNVTYFFSSSTQSLYNIDVLFNVNCLSDSFT